MLVSSHGCTEPGDPPRHQGAVGPGPAPQHLRCLLFRQVLVEVEDDGGALAFGEPEKGLPQILTIIEIGPGRLLPKAPSLSIHVRPLHSLVTEVHAGEVHDRLPEIWLERSQVPKMGQPTEESDEGVLHEIIGQGPVTRQQKRQPKRRGQVPPIQISASGMMLFQIAASDLDLKTRTLWHLIEEMPVKPDPLRSLPRR